MPPIKLIVYRRTAQETEEDAQPRVFNWPSTRNEYVYSSLPFSRFRTHLISSVPILYEVTERVRVSSPMLHTRHHTNSRRQLRKAILNQVEDKPKELDMLHWMTRTALEMIGQSGMGYSFDSLEGDASSADSHPYSRSVKRFGYAPFPSIPNPISWLKTVLIEAFWQAQAPSSLRSIFSLSLPDSTIPVSNDGLWITCHRSGYKI